MSFGKLVDPSPPPAARRSMAIAVAAAAALLLAPPAAVPAGGAEKNSGTQIQKEAPVPMPSLAPLVQRVLPAVVSVSAQVGGETPAQADRSADEGGDQSPSSSLDDLLRRFFENRGSPQTGREATALGSGFIVDPAGFIVTNNHVLGNSSKITVTLQDNVHRPATVVGRDEKTDLAVIKIEAKEKLPFVGWGDSDQAKVGDWVVAVGNAFGLGGTVTAGIVSALGRNINEGPYDDFIQIDAPINRGNSGGPTFDLSGQVIGINTAIYSPSGGSVGIGFAVPSNTANSVVAQLREKGKVTRGWLGVAIQSITPNIARSIGVDPDQPTGALVASVTPKSPAATAGIKQGDVVVSAGGHEIKNVRDLPRIVAAAPIGKKLDLGIRRSGKDMTVAATITEMPAEKPQPVAMDQGGGETAGSLGLTLSAIDASQRRQYRIPKDVDGVVVTKVASDSPAVPLGIEPGDVIVSVDQEPAKTPQQTSEALKSAAAKGSILLLVNRQGASQFVGLSVSGVGSSTPPTGR